MEKEFGKGRNYRGFCFNIIFVFKVFFFFLCYGYFNIFYVRGRVIGNFFMCFYSFRDEGY